MPFSISRSRSAGNRPLSHGLFAFTLIELLVAMAVFAILVVMLMGMVDSASKLWRQSENRMDSYRETRAAIAIMSRDLRNALAGTNTNYILLNENAYPFLADAEKSTNYAGAIFFLAAEPANAQQTGSNRSDVSMVGYFLAYGNSSMVAAAQAGSAMNLYRYFRSSDVTYAKMSNSTASPFDTNILTSDGSVELLARNIKSFRVTALDTNSTPYVATTNAPLPPMVKIEIVALNKDTSKKMRSKDDWTNSLSALSNVVIQNSQTFSTRENLVNKK